MNKQCSKPWNPSKKICTRTPPLCACVGVGGWVGVSECVCVCVCVCVDRSRRALDRPTAASSPCNPSTVPPERRLASMTGYISSMFLFLA